MNNNKKLVIYGEVLFDCFQDGSCVLGGAPFNVAWHCQAFGLNPVFISRVGDDEQGAYVKESMQNWGMSTEGLQVDKKYPTGVVEVKFIDGEPTYDIVKNSAWDFISAESLPKIEQQVLLYHGSLVLRNATSAATLNTLKQIIQPSVFVDVNLRSPWWDISVIEKIVTDCSWLKLNEDELRLIVQNDANIKDSMASLLQAGSLELLVVTQGERGVTASDQQGNIISATPQRATEVKDTVGAGDSFSSVLLLGMYKKWPLQLTLQRAQQFASAIVGIHGATINDKAFYRPFIDEWQLDV